MARYFFDVQGELLDEDHDGVELGALDDAVAEAWALAEALRGQEALRWRGEPLTIRVRDAVGAVLLDVRIGAPWVCD